MSSDGRICAVFVLSLLFGGTMALVISINIFPDHYLQEAERCEERLPPHDRVTGNPIPDLSAEQVMCSSVRILYELRRVFLLVFPLMYFSGWLYIVREYMRSKYEGDI